jgi:ABC-type polar amino acid transport system ATPase subunit
MINGKNVLLTLGGTHILHGVDFHIKKGMVVGLVGKSGAGKTSLLQCIANLVHQYDGTISCNEQNVKALAADKRAQSIGFVFQQFYLFPHLTVLQNCMHPLMTVLKMNKVDAQQQALGCLLSLGVDHVQNKFPSQLSGGQQQRVAIARALCLKPDVLLFDEPTSALDPENSKIVGNLLRELAAKGYTVVVSSHDMTFVKRTVDHIYLMQDGHIVGDCSVLSSSTLVNEFMNCE